MNARDRSVARVPRGAPLEARQAVVDEVTKGKLEPGQGQGLGLEPERRLPVRRVELVIDRLKRRGGPVRPCPRKGGAAQPDGGLRVDGRVARRLERLEQMDLADRLVLCDLEAPEIAEDGRTLAVAGRLLESAAEVRHRRGRCAALLGARRGGTQ